MPDASQQNFSSDAQQEPDLKRSKMPPRFALGQVVSTPGALEKLEETGTDALQLLARHGRGDWGDLDKEDLKANNDALAHGGRLFSAYKLPDGGKVWVITEADRSATTFLLPEEY